MELLIYQWSQNFDKMLLRQKKKNVFSCRVRKKMCVKKKKTIILISRCSSIPTILLYNKHYYTDLKIHLLLFIVCKSKKTQRNSVIFFVLRYRAIFFFFLFKSLYSITEVTLFMRFSFLSMSTIFKWGMKTTLSL